MANTWTDDQLIRAIRAEGMPCRLAEEYLYKTLRNMAVGTVVNSGGRAEEIDEAFPDAFVDVMKQVKKPDFGLEGARLSTYFMKALLRKWATNRAAATARQQKLVEFDPQTHHAGGIRVSVEDDFIREERREKVRAAMESLGERCKQMLAMFADGFSMNAIKEERGFQSEQVAKNEVHTCRNKLRNLLAGKI